MIIRLVNQKGGGDKTTIAFNGESEGQFSRKYKPKSLGDDFEKD